MTGTLDSKVILVPPNSQNFVPSSFSYRSWERFFINFFPKFYDENHTKVKNTPTYTVITDFIRLMFNKRIQTVKLLSYYHLLLSVTCLKVENYCL
jgi:hypothetical protein